MSLIKFRRSFPLGRVLLAVAVLAAEMAVIRAWFAPGPSSRNIWIVEKPTGRTALGARLYAAHRARDFRREEEVLRAVKNLVVSPEVLDRARSDPRLDRFGYRGDGGRERLRRSMRGSVVLFDHAYAPRDGSGGLVIYAEAPTWDEADAIVGAVGDAYIKAVGKNGSPFVLLHGGARASTGSIPPGQWAATLALVVLAALILVLDWKTVLAATAQRPGPQSQAHRAA